MNRMMIGIAFLTFSALAQAQWGPQDEPADRVSALVDRVHADLNRGYGVWNLRGGDRNRLNHADHELREFATHWQRGKFDKGNLDDAIGAVQHVLDNNRLSGRERDALWQDVEQLRGMRQAYDRHEIGRW